MLLEIKTTLSRQAHIHLAVKAKKGRYRLDSIINNWIDMHASVVPTGSQCIQRKTTSSSMNRTL